MYGVHEEGLSLGALIRIWGDRGAALPVAVVGSVFDDLLANGTFNGAARRAPSLDDVVIDANGDAHLPPHSRPGLDQLRRLLAQAMTEGPEGEAQIPPQAYGFHIRLISDDPQDHPVDAEQLRAWLRTVFGPPAPKDELGALVFAATGGPVSDTDVDRHEAQLDTLPPDLLPVPEAVGELETLRPRASEVSEPRGFEAPEGSDLGGLQSSADSEGFQALQSHKVAGATKVLEELEGSKGAEGFQGAGSQGSKGFDGARAFEVAHLQDQKSLEGAEGLEGVHASEVFEHPKSLEGDEGPKHAKPVGSEFSAAPEVQQALDDRTGESGRPSAPDFAQTVHPELLPEPLPEPLLDGPSAEAVPAEAMSELFSLDGETVRVSSEPVLSTLEAAQRPPPSKRPVITDSVLPHPVPSNRVKLSSAPAARRSARPTLEGSDSLILPAERGAGLGVWLGVMLVIAAVVYFYIF